MATHILGHNYAETVNLSTGLCLTVGIEDSVSRSILLCSWWRDYIWEPQTLRLALMLQSRGVTIVAGGHIGYDALHLAQALQMTGGRVIAFEPFSESCEQFLRNQRDSKIYNVILERLALSSHSHAEAVLHIAGSGSSIDVAGVSPADRIEVVQTVSLDDYAKMHSLESVELIFLDVEGSELKVLQGALSLLASSPTIIMEINRPNIRHLGFTPDDVYQFLFARNYSLYFIADDYFFDLRDYYHAEVVLYPLLGDDPHFQSRLTIFNILAVHDSRILSRSGINIMADQPVGCKGTQ
jgi:FkbM family methyltransferase